jgi:hypothetical protein
VAASGRWSLISTSKGFDLEVRVRGGGGEADAWDLGGYGSWRQVQEMEEGVRGLRAQTGWRGGITGRGTRSGGAVGGGVCFELVAVRGAELDASGAVAQHRLSDQGHRIGERMGRGSPAITIRPLTRGGRSACQRPCSNCRGPRRKGWILCGSERSPPGFTV